jgi:hypothetical protein
VLSKSQQVTHTIHLFDICLLANLPIQVKSDINAVKNGVPSTGGDLKSAAASIKNQLTN